MAYEDIAPTISGTGITQNQVDAYFSALPAAPVTPPPPAITSALVQAVADKVFDGLGGIQKHGGITKIAQDVGLTTDQVKGIIKELYALKAAWDELQG